MMAWLLYLLAAALVGGVIGRAIGLAQLRADARRRLDEQTRANATPTTDIVWLVELELRRARGFRAKR